MAIESGPDGSRDGSHTTSFQVVQWTFAAKPGHPIFLDVVHRILDNSLSNKYGRGTDADVFLWTGPAIWADAVWRYLLARWGFDFRRLASITHPVRIGDVLVLPLASFQAEYSERWVKQGDEARVWHGALGRWRDQPLD